MLSNRQNDKRVALSLRVKISIIRFTLTTLDLPYSPMIQLTINGQSQQFDDAMNVTQLIDHLALHGKRFAIERNGEIVPRSQFSQQMLANGDQLEVVVAVGGG